MFEINWWQPADWSCQLESYIIWRHMVTLKCHQNFKLFVNKPSYGSTVNLNSKFASLMTTWVHGLTTKSCIFWCQYGKQVSFSLVIEAVGVTFSLVNGVIDLPMFGPKFTLCLISWRNHPLGKTQAISMLSTIIVWTFQLLPTCIQHSVWIPCFILSQIITFLLEIKMSRLYKFAQLVTMLKSWCTVGCVQKVYFMTACVFFHTPGT